MEKRYLEMLKKIILDYTKNYHIKIYLYGSRAKGIARQFSDVDIAILPIEPIPRNFIAELKDTIENSTIPYEVDVVDLSQSDEKFRKKILSEGVLWKD